MKTIKEDGVMAAGTGGFSSSAAAAGPVAGVDSPLKNRIKKQLQKPLRRAKPPGTPGVMLSDNH